MFTDLDSVVSWFLGTCEADPMINPVVSAPDPAVSPDSHVLFGEEVQWSGVPAAEQLKNQDPQRPAVGGAVVAFVQDDLRGHVLRGPAERPRLLTQTHLLGETKVHLKKKKMKKER